MHGQSQISAYISKETKEQLEQYVKSHGVTRGYLIETALLHHLQALRELPPDVVIPPRVVLTAASGEAVLDRLERPQPPTPAMRALFAEDRGEDEGGDEDTL